MIGIVGCGKWGYALSTAIKNNIICDIKKRRIKNFRPIEEVLQQETLLFAIPTQHTREFLTKYKKHINKNSKILICSKGIETKNQQFLTAIYKNFYKESNIAVLSGPSFASEIKKKQPTCLVIASKNNNTLNQFKKIFPKFIKTYITNDIIGAQIGGAYKNSIAIAAGITESLKLGENAKTSLITRGLKEMIDFGKYFKAKEKTLIGLSGVGDLFLTATHKESRNYQVGLELGKNKSIKLKETAEGIETTETIYQIAKKHKIKTPIINELRNILKGADPRECTLKLLENDQNKEF